MVEGHSLQLDSGRCHHCHTCTAHILMAGTPPTHTYTHIQWDLAWIIFLTAPLKRGRHLPLISINLSYYNSLGNRKKLKKLPRTVLIHCKTQAEWKCWVGVSLILQISLCMVTFFSGREQQSGNQRFTKNSTELLHLCSAAKCVQIIWLIKKDL